MEIKNTTAAEALAEAIARLNDRLDEGIARLTAERDRGLADLKTRESAVSDVNGLIERAKHAYVRDHSLHPGQDVTLSDLRIELNTGQSVRMGEPTSWSGDRRASPFMTAGKTYRFWLLIEELPAEVGHGG